MEWDGGCFKGFSKPLSNQGHFQTLFSSCVPRSPTVLRIVSLVSWSGHSFTQFSPVTPGNLLDGQRLELRNSFWNGSVHLNFYLLSFSICKIYLTVPSLPLGAFLTPVFSPPVWLGSFSSITIVPISRLICSLFLERGESDCIT